MQLMMELAARTIEIEEEITQLKGKVMIAELILQQDSSLLTIELLKPCGFQLHNQFCRTRVVS